MIDSETSVEQLLRSREAKGLIWSHSARLAFLTTIAAAALLGVVVVWPALVVGVCVLGAALSIYCLRLARRVQHLRFVGLAGVVFDLCFLTMIPFLWSRMYGGPDVGSGYLLKLPLLLPIVVLMIVNTMALKPLYPALFAGGSLALYASLAARVLSDPKVETSENLLEVTTGAPVSVNQVILHFLVIFIAGVFLTFLARAARRIVHDVVELEAENLRIVKEQARLIMDVKMAGMANLVAGIAHEINTPLGASMSSAEVVEMCSSTLGDAIQSAEEPGALKKDRKVNRGLTVLKDSSQVIRKAGDRIAGVVSSLKEFSRLDQADFQRADIRTGLESTLSLIAADTKGAARVIKDYEDIPKIECRPKELNQVFMTLLTNAFEAIDGEGELRLRVSSRKDQAMVEISDTGKGIPPEKLESLFDIGFGAKQARMSMGLGLPTAKNTVDGHGGELSVESELGKGTTVRITLPIHNH